MDYTPEQRNGVSAMPTILYGNVLHLGLGEGALVPKILRYPGVRRLVSVEIDPLVSNSFPVSDPRHVVVVADANAVYKEHNRQFHFIVQDLPVFAKRGHWIKTDGWTVTSWSPTQ